MKSLLDYRFGDPYMFCWIQVVIWHQTMNWSNATLLSDGSVGSGISNIWLVFD